MKKNRPPEWQQLTGRQRQVALLVAAGKSSKEIARELDIHFTTVMKHRENLYARLGVDSALSLACWLCGSDV